jgi:hypothetical protein
LNVRYSRRRRRPDQSPDETIETGTASCTGLAILLIDACRSVGVPARFVGIPSWPDRGGNHSWVEIWDNGWHFTGAAEPTGEELNRAWFTDRAASAKADNPRHAIYAVSFKRTPLRFPIIWNRRASTIYAVNVTSRYVQRRKELPPGSSQLVIRVLTGPRGDRVAAAITIKRSTSGATVFEGVSKDERFDMNDDLTVVLPANEEYHLEIRHDGRTLKKVIRLKERQLLCTFHLSDAGGDTR